MAYALTLLLVAVFASLLLAAAWQDLVARRIPNVIAGAIALLGLAAVALGLPQGPWWAALLGAAAVFAVGAGLFAAGVLGGGDVKLLGATALWSGAAGIPELLFVTAVAGGALALMAYVRPFVAAWALGPQTGSRLESVPYGIAIAVGGLWTAHRCLAG